MSLKDIKRWDLKDEIINFSSKVWELRTRRYYIPKKSSEDDFYYLNSPDWVIVIARKDNGNFIIINQFRVGINDFSWEFPGGVIDKDEDPLKAGLRELKEETGYISSNAVLIGKSNPNTAMLNNTCYYVFADNIKLSESGTNWDYHEEIIVKEAKEADIKESILNNEFKHAMAHSAYLHYLLK